LAELLAAREPNCLTIEQRKQKRRGRLYLDTARNAYAQTAVAPYAVRALPGAPVACPIDWQELGRVEPQRFTVRNLGRRLARKDDPWAEMRRDARPARAEAAPRRAEPKGRLKPVAKSSRREVDLVRALLARHDRTFAD